MRLELGGRRDEGWNDEIPRDVEDIARDGRSRWFGAGSGTNEQNVAGKISVDRNGIRDARYFGDGRVLVDECRRHARLDAALGLGRDA